MIRETILTTVAPDGTGHIAPIGLIREADFWVIAPFRPSATLDNLRRVPHAVASHTDDVRVFAGCLTGRRDWPLRPADRVPGFVLATALSHVELSVEAVVEDEQRPRFRCRVVHEANHAPFRGFNRAQAAVIEAAILASRLHILPPEKIASERAYLQIAIDKTAGPEEHEAWGWLTEKIDAHLQGAKAEAGA